MNKRSSTWCIVLAACAALAADTQTAPTNTPEIAGPLRDAGVAKFTFGTPASVTRAGFTKVTVNDKFTPEKGFGFDSTQGLLALDRGGWEITRPKDEYTASVYGA